MKFMFIFTALLFALANAENAEGMRDCSREIQGGVGVHSIFQSDIGHIFFFNHCGLKRAMSLVWIFGHAYFDFDSPIEIAL